MDKDRIVFWAGKRGQTGLANFEPTSAADVGRVDSRSTPANDSTKRQSVSSQSVGGDQEAQLTELAARLAALELSVASRDTGIRLLKQQIAQIDRAQALRRSSIKGNLRDLAGNLARRLPFAASLMRKVLPAQIRRRLSLRLNAAQIHLPHSVEVPLAERSTSAGGFSVSPVAQPVNDKLDLICLAAVEWSSSPARAQHLMSQFARNGYRVFYVVARSGQAADRVQIAVEVAPNVYEVALYPQELRGETSMSPDSAVTLAEALGRLAFDQRIKTATTVVCSPLWAELALQLRWERGWPIVYDCQHEPIGQDTAAHPVDAQKHLADGADLLTVPSAELWQKWAGRARSPLLVRNGADFEFFARHCEPNDLFHGRARPIIGCCGAQAGWLDCELVAAAAILKPDWTFVVLGEVADGALDGMPNVVLPGRRPYSELARYLYHFDAGLLASHVNAATQASDPEKFYEFMSCGKPVVSTRLAEMSVHQGFAAFADDAPAIVAALETAMAEDDEQRIAGRMAFARTNDWSHRFETMETALAKLLPRLSVIVVTYENVELTRLCIDSLLRNTLLPDLEIIVVDNASSDGTRTYLRHMALRHPNLQVVLNTDNKGFAAANNQGLRLAKGDYLVLLNNDTVVPKGWAHTMIRHLADPMIGLVGPVTNHIGNEARIDVDYSGIDMMEAFADRHTDKQAGKAFDIDRLAMFCVMMRRDAFAAVGVLDEGFGIGMFEDDDYSKRMRAKGYRTVCAEDAFVHHFGQAAFRKLIASGEYDRIWKKNQTYYEEKWGPWRPPRGRLLPGKTR